MPAKEWFRLRERHLLKLGGFIESEFIILSRVEEVKSNRKGDMEGRNKGQLSRLPLSQSQGVNLTHLIVLVMGTG